METTDSAAIIEAMQKKLPVIYDGVEYKRITKYILWFDDRGEKRLSAELLDKNGGSVVQAPADRITIKEAF